MFGKRAVVGICVVIITCARRYCYQACLLQRWSPRGRGLGLEDSRGKLMVSLALALASDAKSLALALASQSNLTVLVFGLESKTLGATTAMQTSQVIIVFLL